MSVEYPCKAGRMGEGDRDCFPLGKCLSLNSLRKTHINIKSTYVQSQMVQIFSRGKKKTRRNEEPPSNEKARFHKSWPLIGQKGKGIGNKEKSLSGTGV
ncbi:hypothetical protein E2320_017334 [Naja naja]|nr:hypothetical protein E2320_017334 [Naja naja]